MKNLKKISMYAVVLFATALIMFSCRKDDDGGDSGNAPATGSLQAKVSGASDFKAEGAMATATYVATGKMLTIYGTDLTGRAIQIIINNYDGSTGTWEIPNGVGAIGIVASYIEGSANPSSSQTWVAPYSGSGKVGEVKISEFSSTGSVKGTFTFKGRNQNDSSSFKDVTEGNFNIGVKSY